MNVKFFRSSIQSDQFTMYLDEEGLPKKIVLVLDTGCMLKIFCSLLWCKAGLKDGQKVQLGGGGGQQWSSVSNETV